MDFDLFDQEDDDDLLSAVYCTEQLATQQQPQQQTQSLSGTDYTPLPEFQCSGVDSVNAQFAAEGFVRNSFIGSDGAVDMMRWQQPANDITLSSYDFQAAHLRGNTVTQFVFGEACMHLQHLASSVRSPPIGGHGHTIVASQDSLSYYQRRRQVTQLLHLVLHTTTNQAEQWPLLRAHLTNLRALLNRITTPETWKLIYYANSSKGNEACNVPAYHLLHGALEWKLLDLCILQKFGVIAVMTEENKNATLSVLQEEQQQHPQNKPSPFLVQLERTFDDLIVCSVHVYTKKCPVELLHSSPFPCTCLKEFWLILQLVLLHWSTTNAEQRFWSLFNKAMERLKAKIADYSLTSLGFSEFANWMLHALTRLHGYRSNGSFIGANYSRACADSAENYEFLESNTQAFLTAANNAAASEEQLRVYICLATPTLQQWWRPPRITIPMLLWEHFHKRLNTAFYITGAPPSNLAVVCASGRAYLDKYRALLDAKTLPDANLSSFTLFTLLLGKTLTLAIGGAGGALNQAQKLLGRIYSKFSAHKFLALNETGIHHLVELFLVLALSGDFAHDLAPKLREKLLSLALDKISATRQIAVMKGHVALLILHAEQRCDFSDYAAKLLAQLARIRNEPAVTKLLADGLLDIFAHADDFRRGEIVLIDAWLPQLLNSCTAAEQERSLEALHFIFEKMGNGASSSSDGALFGALNSFVLPFLKQQYVSNFSARLPQLAADFCIHSDVASYQRNFTYFIEAPVANRQALPQFLLNILASERGTSVPATVVMQMWLRSLVVLTAVNEQVAQLTRHVVQLPDFASISNLQAADILTAKEPLCVFIAAVGKTYDACAENFTQRCRVADTFCAYLRNFERWLPPPQLDIRNEKTEISFRFYSFLAIVIYNCPRIVYARSQVTCFFHLAMTHFILPTNLQVGKVPEPRHAQLIHKIWPVLVQGIGRLSFKTDAYLNKTLSDLIQRWTPHFKISPNSKVVARPFITCLQGDNQTLSLFVFEKLTSMFLATQRRQADPHACLVVTIFQEVVDALQTNPDDDDFDVNSLRLETFMKGTCLLTLEHIMMVDEVVPSRQLLLDFFKRLIQSTVFCNAGHLQALLAEHLRILTKKHLAYYTFFFFELLMKMAKISPTLVAQIMDYLLEEVRVVEQKRGAGADNRIRGCVQQLQKCIAGATKAQDN